MEPPFSRLVASLPATVPFVPPEALERRSGRRIRLRLGANESVFGISPLARQAIIETIDRIAWYADPESFELRERFACLLGVRRENIVAGSGIDDLLGLVVRTFLDPGSSAVTSLGAYPTFNYHVEGYGGVVHRVPYRQFRNDLEGLLTTAERVRARLIYLANPDNPTGTWHDRASLRDLVDRIPHGCLLLLDEAYGEFLPAEDALPIDAADPRLIRCRTFSKAHGMAGARIGYAIAAPEIISAFNKVRVQFGVNMFAQVAALASLDDPQFVAMVVARVAEGREDYYQLGQELRMPAIRSATNFVALDTGAAANARFVRDTLFERDVFIRIPGAPPLDHLIRVTVGTPPERAAFAHVMRELGETNVLACAEPDRIGARAN